MGVTPEAVLAVLRGVQDPELKKSLVELGMIRDVHVSGTLVRITLALTMAGCPLKGRIKADIDRAVRTLAGVSEIDVILTTMTPDERAKLFCKEPCELAGIKDVGRIIAVASGKGGVGKTTLTVNLAAALSQRGFKVGILDADLHGPNVPIMLGIEGRPQGSQGMLLPLERFGLKVMSTGTLAGEGVPIIWRGPLVNKAIKEFLGKVQWGVLDFLLVDLPPGTGDAAITVSKVIPLEAVVIVTTPQKVAVQDVRRSIGLFVREKIPILGVVENMSFLRMPSGEKDYGIIEVFGSGGGEEIASECKVPFLGKIPLDPEIREGGDSGQPIAFNKDNESARVFNDIAARVIERLACTADLRT